MKTPSEAPEESLDYTAVFDMFRFACGYGKVNASKGIPRNNTRFAERDLLGSSIRYQEDGTILINGESCNESGEMTDGFKAEYEKIHEEIKKRPEFLQDFLRIGQISPVSPRE